MNDYICVRKIHENYFRLEIINIKSIFISKVFFQIKKIFAKPVSF